MDNMLVYGDNLQVLRKEIKDDSVDLIYLDPPFNSNKDYNEIFKADVTNKNKTAQIIVFEDTWNWDNDVEKQYFEIVRHGGNNQVSQFLISMREFLGTNKMMAYLTMMAPRLLELHRVLKPTGALLLHCDPAASHYLKLLLDATFGVKNFQNEIIWCYRQGGRSSKRFAKKHDVIFLYSKEKNFKINVDDVRIPYHGTGGFVNNKEGHGGNLINGKLYKPHPNGKIPEDWWDIPALTPTSKERVGYPTQKPLELLERIILSCSNKNGVVLDPFCGCGTAVIAAEKLNRKWIGIDVTHIAIATIKKRLESEFGTVVYTPKGIPIDLSGAEELAQMDRFEFQLWALSLLGINSTSGMKKGADGGVDGVKFFEDNKKAKKCVIQVKSGKVSVKDIRELKAVVDKESAELGILETLKPPTKNMVTEAASFGLYHMENGNSLPIIQIIIVEDILNHKILSENVIPY